MREERLLERIQKIEDDPDRRESSDHVMAVNSVLTHLRKILNTRQGSVPIADDFGVPDYTSFKSNLSMKDTATMGEIEDAIKKSVLKYEPRLHSISISFIESEDLTFSFLFDISATMKTDDGEIPIVIKTSMTPEGEVSLSV
jgi:type VI secretion system protein